MKRVVWLALSVALVLATGPIGTSADPPKKDQPAKTDPSGQADPKEKKETNRVRYARTYVELARLDLQIAKDFNVRVAETLPPAIMLVIEEHVALAELWLKQEEAEAAGKPPTDLAVKMAEIRLKRAELQYAELREANRIASQPPQNLERLRLKVELAKLNVAGAKELDASKPVELLEFEFERLREEISEMYIRQLKLLDRN
jgi:hypothetical protein